MIFTSKRPREMVECKLEYSLREHNGTERRRRETVVRGWANSKKVLISLNKNKPCFSRKQVGYFESLITFNYPKNYS